MEPQLETATVLVCGTAIPVTAEELELAGLQVKGPEAFSALGWDGSLANIKACRHLTHLNLTACGLGPKHAADLAAALEGDPYFLVDTFLEVYYY